MGAGARVRTQGSAVRCAVDGGRWALPRHWAWDSGVNGRQPVVTRAVRRCKEVWKSRIPRAAGSGRSAAMRWVLLGRRCLWRGVLGRTGAAVRRVEMLLRRGAVACLCRGRRVVHSWEWLCTVVCIEVSWECAALRAIVGYGLPCYGCSPELGVWYGG